MIALDGVSKRFRRRPVLDGVSLTVAEGTVVGLVGPLGAGKSTVLRILATLLAPDRGEAMVAGTSSVRQPRQARRLLGYVPARPGTYAHQTVLEYVELCAGLRGVTVARRSPVSEELLEVVALADRAGDEVTSLSLGQRRRLALAGCLVHDPAVLLLDEPLTDLTGDAADQLQGLVTELAGLGKTVLATGRDADPLRGMCDVTVDLRDLGGHTPGSVAEPPRTSGEGAPDEPGLLTSPC